MPEFFYHLLPEPMLGHTLYPLASLKSKAPKLAKKLLKNYEGREALLHHPISPLHCEWQDVLFFSSVDPALIFAALELLGLLKERQKVLHFPIEALKNKPICKYIETEKSEHFEPLHIGTYKELHNLPKETVQYFIECAKTNDSPLIFFGVPHIILRGSLSIELSE